MMKTQKILIKIGGAALQNAEILQGVAETVKAYRRYDYQVLVVHGGGPAINEELSRRGIPWTFHEGQRVTTRQMMDCIEMVLSGSMNSRIVRALGKIGAPALGFSGTDGSLLKCHQASEILGQVGAIDEVNTAWIEALMAVRGRPIPVVAPLGVGENGETFNINADWAASRLAVALEVDQLVYFTDQDGVWGSDKKVIRDMDQDSVQELLDGGSVAGGMLTKVKAAKHALDNGVNLVRILNAKDAKTGLWTDRIGTSFTRTGWVRYPPEPEVLNVAL